MDNVTSEALINAGPHMLLPAFCFKYVYRIYSFERRGAL